MNRLALAASALAAISTAALLALAASHVSSLTSRELDRAGAVVPLAPAGPTTLIEHDVLVGDDLAYELCTSDAMDATRWDGALTLTLEAVEGDTRQHLLDQRVDGPLLTRARRGASGACFDFFEVGPLEAAGHFVLVAREVAPAVAGLGVRARVTARRPLDAGDRNVVLGILLGAIALVIALALRPPAAAVPAIARPWRAGATWGVSGGLAVLSCLLVLVDPRMSIEVRTLVALLVTAATLGSGFALSRGGTGGGAVLGVVGIVDLSTLLTHVPIPGPAFGLVAGLLLAASEVGVAAGLARALEARPPLVVLALERPSRASVAFAGFLLAPIVGVVLRIAATRVLGLVPSTGEAPIEAYVSWPSGLLSFAALSAVAPIGEEVFFRGLVYGAIRGEGGRARETAAFLGAWLLFVLAHIPQTWGSWGGLAAVAIAGLGFTTLRATTGSVLVSSLAHLVYNGLLAAAALAAA